MNIARLHAQISAVCLVIACLAFLAPVAARAQDDEPGPPDGAARAARAEAEDGFQWRGAVPLSA